MLKTAPTQSEIQKELNQARVLRVIQGLSLWATILLFFVMQSVAARAGDEPNVVKLPLETANSGTINGIKAGWSEDQFVYPPVTTGDY